jgi:hypothetical protein
VLVSWLAEYLNSGGLAPEKRWHQKSAGTRKVLAPENAGTREVLTPEVLAGKNAGMNILLRGNRL